MASHSHRGTALVRDEEPRRDERDEELRRDGEEGQQGLPVPPPLPVVDFGAIMQGSVQMMQTQADAHAALQAQVQAQVRVCCQRLELGILG